MVCVSRLYCLTKNPCVPLTCHSPGRACGLASALVRYLIVNASGADTGFGVATERGSPEHTRPAV